ncbi:hypothetical protein BGX34_006215 [Mortierella sp. NVP85]|nr:hypothetical protein BGX34_006215 [Mortierella sp. NVP85]
MEHNLPGLSEELFTGLILRDSCPLASLTPREAALYRELDQELMETRIIAGRAPMGTMLDNIVFIYQSITLFPIRQPKDFSLSWANRPAQGSKYRRGNPLKPDGAICKAGHEATFLEIKPPRMEKDALLFLKDYWKLANLCKDAIGLLVQVEPGIRTMVLYTGK